jgi:hypothetical protein
LVRKPLFLILSSLVVSRGQDAGATRAEIQCERIDEPGRIHCEVEARVATGEAIADGDVVILRAPPFVTVLRGRTGPRDATTRDAEVWRWALALAARKKGSGEVGARVRLVVCRRASCAPREVLVVGRVVVGYSGADQSAGGVDGE